MDHDKTQDKRIAAIFDVDGTMIAGASMEQVFARFLWRRGVLRATDIGRFLLGGWQALRAGQSPLIANKAYLHGQDAAQLRRLARACFATEIAPRLLPDAVRRLHWHQCAGHFVVLLSGALDPLLEPLAESLGVSARIGTQLEVVGRQLTGRIAGVHPYGIAKAECLRELNRTDAFDLKRSFAYANHYSDRHLLALVGYPVATNADARLRQFAQRKGWLCETFTRERLDEKHVEAWL